MLTEWNFDTLLDTISAETGNYLAGVKRQLYPIKKIWDINAHYILDGVFYGFHVIDPILPPISYHQQNYSSCYFGEVEEKLFSLLWGEIKAGKLSILHKVPDCVHALGAVSPRVGSGPSPIAACRKIN